jgi:ATP adenylyltransferase
VNRLWAPWRIAYVAAAERPLGCIFCQAREGTDDIGALVLQRADDAFLILNAYPYSPGHLMAVVNRHIGTIAEATGQELADTMRLVQAGVRALAAEYRPDGFNIGINQGRVAGAGIEDHLHVHVVPRWNGDTNFMPVLGEVKVLPESLERTRARLTRAL